MVGPLIPNLRERIDLKLAEAEFFLQKLRELENGQTVQLERDRQVFLFYASAFLNAVRAPLQYILDSVRVPHPLDPNMAIIPTHIQSWYDHTVNHKAPLSFITPIDRSANNHSISTSQISEMVRKFDIEFSEALNARWREYGDAEQSVVSSATAVLSEVRNLVDDAWAQGYIPRS